MMQPRRPRRPVVPRERRDQIVQLLSRKYTAPGWAYVGIVVASVLASSTIYGIVSSIFALVKIGVVAAILVVALIAILRFGVGKRNRDS